MKLRTLRGLALGVVTIACSTDVLVVATLDGAGGTSTGGDAGTSAKGGGEADAGASFTETSAGTAGSSGASDSGGSSGAGGTASEGGAGSGAILHGTTTTNICACRSDPTFVCGADGVTYDPTCSDGCSQVTIACFHACPCDNGESGAPNAEESGWMDADCFDVRQCATGFLCIPANADKPPPPCTP